SRSAPGNQVPDRATKCRRRARCRLIRFDGAAASRTRHELVRPVGCDLHHVVAGAILAVRPGRDDGEAALPAVEGIAAAPWIRRKVLQIPRYERLQEIGRA